jgi:hypothetical protein
VDTIVISAGAKEGAFMPDEPGSYPATLVSVERRGPFDDDKKPGETYYMLEWGFAIEGQPDDACMVWYSTSEMTGPKSKMYGLISALYGGREAPVGTKLDVKTQLIGREVLVGVGRNPKGYMTVTQVLPKMAARSAPPVAPAPAPVPVAVAPTAATNDPF